MISLNKTTFPFLLFFRLVDCFLVDKAASSLSMSPTGDFLVTSHVDDVGVYLWSNMTLYSFVSLSPLPADFEPRLLDLPTTSYTHTGTSNFDGLYTHILNFHCWMCVVQGLVNSLIFWLPNSFLIQTFLMVYIYSFFTYFLKYIK